MQMSDRALNGVTILDLDGKLTIGDSADLLSQNVKRLITAGHNKLIINLAKVPYVDSGGLGQLVQCFVSARKADGAVKLIGLTAKITDLLAITKLVTVFETFDSEPQALASFANKPVAVPA